MEYKKFDSSYLLRPDPGDEVVSCITELIRQEGIRLASIKGIGACNEAEIGLYEVEKRHYEMRRFSEEMEMLALNGNISEKDGEPYLHLHAVFGRADMSVIGGHLNKAVISGTGEIFIETKEGALERKVDERTGLNVWAFEKETR